MTKRQKFFSALGRFFKEFFTKNIFLKVVALLFAILLWGYVLSIENPEYTKRVRDVEISILGESTLNARGLMLVTRDTGTTDVDVLCRINKHSELDATRITCTIDLASRPITLGADENSKVITFDVQVSVPTEYGTVQSIEVSSVDLEVARISTRNNVQISVQYAGSLPEGFTVEVPSGLSISMTGRKSLIDRIARGEVTVVLDSLPINDPQTLANTYDLVLPVRFYDSTNVLLDDLVSSTGEEFTANVQVTIRAFREFDIEPSIELLEEGYTYRYVLSRSKIVLFGERSVLDQIDFIRTETVTAMPNMNSTPMSVSLILPDGTELAAGAPKTITITMFVEEQTETQIFTIPITYENINADAVSLSPDAPNTVTVVVYGPMSLLQAFQKSWVKATVNCYGYADGVLTLPVQMKLDDKANGLTVSLQEETVEVVLLPVEIEQP